MEEVAVIPRLDVAIKALPRTDLKSLMELIRHRLNVNADLITELQEVILTLVDASIETKRQQYEWNQKFYDLFIGAGIAKVADKARPTPELGQTRTAPLDEDAIP